MKRFVAFFLCLLILPAALADGAPTLAGEVLSGMLERAGAADVQAWLDHANVGDEWTVIALRQSGTEYDFSAYRQRLEEYLAGTAVRSASTRLKYAFALLAVGGDGELVARLAEESVGQQGVMSWIFGLHLMNNGIPGDRPGAVDALLSLQLEDGGWAVSGPVSDVDVTAMALQALAPDYGRDDRVTAAVDKGLLLLENRQREDGGFASYGVGNPESAAQVLIALASLGVDGLQDERFLKKGNTLLDGMLLYRLPDGSFSHTLGGGSNPNATTQVFFALAAYQRLMEGKQSIYLLDPGQEPAMKTSLDGKTVASLVIAGMAALACVLLLILKKRSGKNFLAVLVMAAVLVGLVWSLDFQSADRYYSGQAVTKENAVGTVTLSIRCDVLEKKPDHVPQDGLILPETSFPIAPGDTVYTILTEAAQVHRIHLETNGGAGMRYVAGISNLYEFDFGDLSGWIFRVNGQEADQGCEQYALQDGDKIEWLYTCEMGNDLN